MNEFELTSFLASFGRCAAFMFTAPLLGSPAISTRIRVVAAALVALAIAGGRPATAMSSLVLILPAEILLGLIAGFAGRIVMAGAESGGQLIGLQFGLGLATFFDPTVGEAALVTRRLAGTLAGLAYLAVGGLEDTIRVVATAPVSIDLLAGGVLRVIDQTGEVLVTAVRFAAPAMMAGLVANIGIAIASRASPAFNIFSVMLAASLIGGGITMLTTADIFVSQMSALGHLVVEATARAMAL